MAPSLGGSEVYFGRAAAPAFRLRVGCGGVQVCPGDGVVVVPQAVAAEVAAHARAILLADMRGRRKLYERLGMSLDETGDYKTVEADYRAATKAAT